MKGQADRVWGFPEGSGEDRVLRYLVGKKRPVPQAELQAVFPDIHRLGVVLASLQDAVWVRSEPVYQVNRAQLQDARKKRRAEIDKARRARSGGKRTTAVSNAIVAALTDLDRPADLRMVRNLTGHPNPGVLLLGLIRNGRLGRVWGKTSGRHGWHYYVPGTAAERWNPAGASEKVSEVVANGPGSLAKRSGRRRNKRDQGQKAVDAVPDRHPGKGQPPRKHDGEIEAKSIAGHSAPSDNERVFNNTQENDGDNAGLRCDRCSRSKSDVKRRKVPRPANWNTARKGPFQYRQDLCDDCWGVVNRDSHSKPQRLGDSHVLPAGDSHLGMSIEERYRAGLLMDPNKRASKMLIGEVK
ncbi:hypothetical protein KQI63_09775 [bacterium]|nr:hypothetical protein [bacterium]